ncbi:uncharacterized protein LOC121864063 isoform X1 [Homarus americanus]|uniref:Putative Acetyltransferase (GNAT) domain-containing protein 1 n=1 Tax=Homarus americanus TaxID=6706 RepID=A0A8J5N1A3_HOMAM|nr:uncharacterized protein LOC121864063 isoform X1 [Homarus americanus]KAG7170781.1 putative Acetyltransferase (GNAT) domain-containing protein 1 [Homarus americanus]
MAGRFLRCVHGKELLALKERLAAHLPNSAILHGTVETGIRYGLMEKLGIKLFIPKHSGSLVVATPAFTTKKVQSLSVFWNPEEEDEEEVAQMIGSLPGIDWRKPVFFSTSSKTISSKVTSIGNNQLVGDGNIEAHTVEDSSMYEIPPQLPHIQCSPPEGFYLDSLRPEEVALVMPFWMYQWTETYSGHETLLRSVPSVALRKRGDGDPTSKDQLVGWIHLYNNGILGNFFVLPEYRGQGLSKVILYELVWKVQKDGLFTYGIFDAHMKKYGENTKKYGTVRHMDMEAVFYLAKGDTVDGFMKTLL